MKVTPASTAACSTARASASLTTPQSPPSCHAPSPTTPTLRPVRPSFRCCTTASILTDVSGPLDGLIPEHAAALYQKVLAAGRLSLAGDPELEHSEALR